MAENENIPADETKAEGTPGTDAAQPKQDGTLEDKLNMWRNMSRENERKMHENLKRATDAEGQLAKVRDEYAQAQSTIARLEAKAKWRLTDDVMALCDKTSPEGIAAWAESAAKLFQPASDPAPSASGTDARRPLTPDAEEGYSHTAPRMPMETAGTAATGEEYGRRFAAIKTK